MKVRMHVQGGPELQKALGDLSTRLSRKIVREALEFGGEPIRAEASRKAPRAPGAPDLADNIVIGAARATRGDVAAVAVGPRPEFRYGFYQEMGTAHHAAQPFMRPAFENQKGNVVTRFAWEIWRTLAARGISRSGTSDTPVSSPGGGGLL